MSIKLNGALEDRGAWRVENCSIAMTMEIIGTRSSMLILREAIYGTTRFDDFVRRTKGTDAIVSARLKQLTDIGLFEKRPYKEEGKRKRYEYVLTPKGADLMPAVFALMQWGNQYLQSDDGGPLRLVKRGTDIPVVIGPHAESDAQLGFDDVEIAANGNWIEQGHD
ncbi:MAG: helix-turn-helix domain-containing protein [Pseudomonas graminis]